MSQPPAISIDTDNAAARVAELRAKADDIERMGAPPVSVEELRSRFGPIYEGYVQSKAGEFEAREAAYRRLAAEYRDHADKLENTHTTFSDIEDESARRIASAGEV